jgi:hypothetical protein
MSFDSTPNFDEWHQELHQLSKVVSGGAMSPLSPSAAGGSRIPPPGRPASYSAGPSRYDSDLRLGPQPWIDDVSMQTDWLSPQQPIWPLGPPAVTQPRSWDYPIGYNLNYVQGRVESLRMFRSLARSWGVLSTIITTRQDQLMRIPWTIQKKDKPQQKSAAVDSAKAFMRRPDGQLSYSQWANKLLFDILEIDAPAIYFLNDRTGRPLKAVVMDGTTFFPLIDDMGLRPSTELRLSPDGTQYLLRQPAFQQIIKGMPLVDLDESELMYVPMRPRPDMPMFGYPGTEQIIVETTEAIRKTWYQLNFWAEGTIPDLIVTVPDTWSPRQIAMFQAHFDAVMSGNLQIKSKVRFMPGGMKPFDIKNSSGESLWSQRDETLIRLACYAYSVSPTPFIKQVNRSVAQNAQESAEQEGLYPLMAFWKDNIIDPILERLGFDDIEFVFLPRPERDGVKQATILDMYVKRGIFSINKALETLGEEPIEGGDVHNIELGNAIVPVKAAADGLAMPMGSVGAVNQSPGGSDSAGARSAGRPQIGSGPQRGTPRPNHEAPVAKIDRMGLDGAAASADGDVNRHSYARLAAGNYKKGHIKIGGLDISVENARHSTRGKRNPDGSLRWANEMPAHYGYIRGTIGADGDQVDVFLGPKPTQLDRIWIIDQAKLSRKGNVKFDEHKVMLGYKSAKKALKDYQRAYGDRVMVGAVTELSLDGLKSWLKDGDLTKPLGGDISKADTISNAANILASNFSRRKRKRAVEVENQIH